MVFGSFGALDSKWLVQPAGCGSKVIKVWDSETLVPQIIWGTLVPQIICGALVPQMSVYRVHFKIRISHLSYIHT